MKTRNYLRTLLAPGDRRTIGRVPEVVDTVLRDLGMLPSLVECLFDQDLAICMRAADALEKVSRTQTHSLNSYASALIDLLAQASQQELQWHLVALLPRLQLSDAQRNRCAELFEECLTVRSAIVKTFALQSLYELSLQERSLMPRVTDLLRAAQRSGTPAMKARSGRLLAQLVPDADR